MSPYFSSDHVGTRDLTQEIRLSSKRLYLLSLLFILVFVLLRYDLM